MKEFVQKETTRKKRNKKLERWAYVLFFVGFMAICGGMGNEDLRNQMTPEQAKKELPKPSTSFAMMGAGALSMLGGAALLLARRDSIKLR